MLNNLSWQKSNASSGDNKNRNEKIVKTPIIATDVGAITLYFFFISFFISRRVQESIHFSSGARGSAPKLVASPSGDQRFSISDSRSSIADHSFQILFSDPSCETSSCIFLHNQLALSSQSAPSASPSRSVFSLNPGNHPKSPKIGLFQNVSQLSSSLCSPNLPIPSYLYTYRLDLGAAFFSRRFLSIQML